MDLLNGRKHSPKILVRSPNWVGDAVMATPVPRALKRTQPSCRIHVLARPWVAPVWERHPDVERVIVMPKRRAGLWAWLKLILVLRKERYDLGLVLPNSFSAAWLAFWTVRQGRVGYATEGRSWLLNHHLVWHAGMERLPRPQIYLNLACAAGADVDLTKEWVFTLKITADELARADALLGPAVKEGRIGLAPGSVAASRRWPAERFAQLANALAQDGRQIVLLGSPPDAPAAQAVAAAMAKKPVQLAGRTSLREAMAVIKRLDLLISNDSGAMHLAYALGVPVLVLQGAADPRVTGPFGAASRFLRAEGVPCSPCVRNDCAQTELACMLRIPVERALAVARDMLAERSARNRISSER